MNETKRVLSVWFDKKLYRKIHTIHMIKNSFFGDKKFTMSLFIETAVREYLNNHDKEIKELIDRYHNEGGCAEI